MVRATLDIQQETDEIESLSSAYFEALALARGHGRIRLGRQVLIRSSLAAGTAVGKLDLWKVASDQSKQDYVAATIASSAVNQREVQGYDGAIYVMEKIETAGEIAGDVLLVEGAVAATAKFGVKGLIKYGSVTVATMVATNYAHDGLVAAGVPKEALRFLQSIWQRCSSPGLYCENMDALSQARKSSCPIRQKVASWFLPRQRIRLTMIGRYRQRPCWLAWRELCAKRQGE